LLLGVVDPESRTFSYARAGHNHPVWRRGLDGETRLLGARGIGLGLNSGELFDRTLELEKITLGAGDLLILYSDGISEAMNESREEYGEMRLQAVASRADGMSASKVKDLILGDVRSFLGRTPPQDDQTLVVVKVLS
jgi:phosphoserine phosphatase RsbU/P